MRRSTRYDTKPEHGETPAIGLNRGVGQIVPAQLPVWRIVFGPSAGRSASNTTIGVRHGFAVRTHPRFDPETSKASFGEARRFIDLHLH